MAALDLKAKFHNSEAVDQVLRNKVRKNAIDQEIKTSFRKNNKYFIEHVIDQEKEKKKFRSYFFSFFCLY